MGQRRTLWITPERLERWLTGFSERHDGATYDAERDRVVVRADDGSTATCAVPFPPLELGDRPPYGALVEHALRDRQVGVLLVRRGGHAAGVFDGRTLIASKVGSRHVQGRSAAGGWSQQRFARRREQQATKAFEAAAEVAVRVLMPYADTVDAVVLGGDRQATTRVLGDRRLGRLGSLVVGEHLDVPDPKLAVLRDSPRRFRAVRIDLEETE